MDRLLIRLAVNSFKVILVFIAIIVSALAFVGMLWLYKNDTSWFWAALIFIIISACSVFEAANPD